MKSHYLRLIPYPWRSFLRGSRVVVLHDPNRRDLANEYP